MYIYRYSYTATYQYANARMVFFIGSSYVAGPDGSRTPVSEIVINIMQL